MSTKEELICRYNAALHAMQSGVAMEMNDPDRESATSPKHLRVGINASLVEHSALVTLLLAKGIITELEYFEALAIAMEAEQAKYEERLSEKHDYKVKLG